MTGIVTGIVTGIPTGEAIGGAFDAAFRARAPHLDCRPAHDGDRAFLTDLFVACSPLGAMLPGAMIQAQAQMQSAAYADTYPGAMHRIALRDGVPIGRFLIDWDDQRAYGIDLAVLPGHRATHAGTHLLRAWLEVADRLDRPATLQVRADNPARRLYARLGFVAVGQDSPDPMVTMARPVATG